MNRLFKIAFIIAVGTFYLGVKSHAESDAPNRPAGDRPAFDRPDHNIPEALRDRIQDYRATQQELRSALRDLLHNLDNPTVDEIRAVRVQFRSDNLDLIQEHHQAARHIRHALHNLKNDRPRHGPISDDPAVVNLRDTLRDKRSDLAQARRTLRDQLDGLSDEGKAALIEQFHQDHAIDHNELKDLRRQLHDAVREAHEGADEAAG